MTDVERLLTLVNGAALHKALREQGVGVSYRTVARWIGATPSAKPPAEMMPALEAVLGTTKEPPEPDWLEGLVREIRMNRAVIQATFAGADPTFARRVLDRLAALEGPPALPDGEGLEELDAATTEPPSGVGRS